jgi:hypothetical protein
MSNHTDNAKVTSERSIDPFSDPVAYLAGLGIEAELVETRMVLPEAA